jgi:hypothetical protein
MMVAENEEQPARTKALTSVALMKRVRSVRMAVRSLPVVRDVEFGTVFGTGPARQIENARMGADLP